MDQRDLPHRLEVCLDSILVDPTTFPIYTEEYNFLELDMVVVRDDLLCGGTKSRVLYPYLINSGLANKYSEFIYVSPSYGGAQIALA